MSSRTSSWIALVGSLSVVMGTILLLAGCQTDGPRSVSLDEAMELTADFQDASFTPPPRTVDDIVALVENTPVKDPERLAQVRRTLEKPLPDTKDKIKQAQAHPARGLAAHNFGWPVRALEELRKAKEYADATKGGTLNGEDLLRELAWSERRAGSWDAAIRNMKRLATLTQRRSAYSGLVRIYARIGDIEKTEATRDRRMSMRGGTGAWNRIHVNTMEWVLLGNKAGMSRQGPI